MGQTFESIAVCPSVDAMRISDDGQYVFALCDDGVYRSSSGGDSATFIQTLAISGGKALRASDNGQYLIFSSGEPQAAGDAYFSADYGSSWTLVGIAENVAAWPWISPNGKYVTIADHGLESGVKFYFSTDYGSSWSSKIVASDGYDTGNVTISNDGQYWFVDSNRRGLYLSTDYGSTFSQILYDTDIAVRSYGVISTDGNVAYGSEGNDIVVYRNYFTDSTILSGLNWTPYVNDTQISDDGRVVLVRDRISLDYGQAFSQPHPNCFFREVSHDGQSVICIETSSGTVRLSQDSGQTFSVIYILSGLTHAIISDYAGRN
jgi:hypothetical protein